MVDDVAVVVIAPSPAVCCIPVPAMTSNAVELPPPARPPHTVPVPFATTGTGSTGAASRSCCWVHCLGRHCDRDEVPNGTVMCKRMQSVPMPHDPRPSE